MGDSTFFLPIDEHRESLSHAVARVDARHTGEKTHGTKRDSDIHTTCGNRTSCVGRAAPSDAA